MKKEKLNPVVLSTNIICALLLIAMVAVLFLPTWQYEGGTLSLGSYIGFPTEKNALLWEFNETFDLGFNPDRAKDQRAILLLVNDIVTVPVCVILLTAVGIFLCFVSHKVPATALVALVAGILGAVGYSGNRYIAQGSTQMILTVVSVVTAVIGLAGIIVFIVSLVKKIKAEKVAQ